MRRNKYRILISLLIIVGSSCIAQIPDDFPVVSRNDLPEAEFTNVRTFNGSSLFGYMDGGAELYLEYGFSALLVMNINFMDGKYKTEIYKMNQPEEAFGIYSVSKFRCLDMPPLSKFTCRTKFQLQICKGHYYISIINGTGSSSDSTASAIIGRIIVDKIKESEIELSDLLPGISDEELQTQSFLARGRLGIVNGSPDLEDYFLGISDYTALIVKRPGEKIMSVKFENDESCRKFLEQNDSFIGNGLKKQMLTKFSDSHLLIELTN